MSKSSRSITDSKLALYGANNVALAEANMAPLLTIRNRFEKEKPFKNVRIGMALHVTKETAVLAETLVAGGAQVTLASCNPLSTQDDVAAYLNQSGIATYAYKGESKNDYYAFIKKVIESRPHITIDDGCDLVYEIHKKYPQYIDTILGGCEETTTGVLRLKVMESKGALKYPVIAVNDNKTKHLFDNYYGTGQSTWDGIIRATNTLVAGKTIVVAGYGSCGRGIALRADGMGAHVIITEIDPIGALQAHMDGYRVMPMKEASSIGDIFVTATGNKNVITTTHMAAMKPGALLANSGHFNCEIDVEGLEKITMGKKKIRPFMTEYSLHIKVTSKKSHHIKKVKKIYILGEGRLINLAAAEGHPSEVMALSFCGQALACEWIMQKQMPQKTLLPKVYTLPEFIDHTIGKITLGAWKISIDALTKDQKKYLSDWQQGT